ncbi:MAG: hypothetical protein ABSB35_29540 [Bryobacteraceae bacterium]|jgi:hypothetical protein
MSKQFWTFLAAGLGVVAIGIAVLLLSTKSAHLELKGQILKVRVLALSPTASIVVVDFRATNPSDIPFVVRTAGLLLDPIKGEAVDGAGISKPDVENVFKYEKLVGPKYNDVLSIKDKIPPHQTVDRMIGARFEMSEVELEGRKDFRVHIEDLDGAVAEIVESRFGALRK